MPLTTDEIAANIERAAELLERYRAAKADGTFTKRERRELGIAMAQLGLHLLVDVVD